MAGKTTAESGNPLNVENFSVLFENCGTSKNICGTAVMEGAPTSAAIRASSEIDGTGAMMAAITLRFQCGAEINCKYKAAALWMTWFGGNFGIIRINGEELTKETIGGEVGCNDRLEWYGEYLVSAPQPVWTSN